MGNVDRHALAHAASRLVEDPDAMELYNALLKVCTLAAQGVPVQLTDDLEDLNPLVDLHLGDPTAIERAVLPLVNKRREQRGLPPLGSRDINRNAYMRELMATKRERERRLVELANRLRSENDRIQGQARIDFLRRHAARWQDVRKEREELLREQLGRRLTQDELVAVVHQLWEDADAELDAFESFVEKEERKPLRARTPDGFQFRLQPKGNS